MEKLQERGLRFVTDDYSFPYPGYFRTDLVQTLARKQDPNHCKGGL